MTALFEAPTSHAHSLIQRMQKVVRAHSASSPRSLQVNLGPSEVGHDCARRLSYRMLDWPQTNNTSDPWPAISGTAIHAWLADAFEADTTNEWLVEHRVTINNTLAGSCDLFDKTNGVVIDHKCVGNASMKARKAEGPTKQQLIQLSLYAYGLELEGHTVNKIALMFYPLGGMLNGMHSWIGDYDKHIAIDALARLDSIRDLIVALDPEAMPERWSMIPAQPSRSCTYCSWFKPGSTDLSTGCPGDSA